MNLVRTAPISPLAVAQSRWDEASRVTDAFRLQAKIRQRRAWSLTGKPGEVDAWASLREAEGQLAEAEALEIKASKEVAWEEHQANQGRMARGYTRRGR